MWWCYGKTSKEAQGCKYSKHISKEDEEDFDEKKEKDEIEKMKNKKITCISCKVQGHRSTECPNDPNIRTNQQAEKELDRIQNIKLSQKVQIKAFSVI